jgi:hypothetical protein
MILLEFPASATIPAVIGDATLVPQLSIQPPYIESYTATAGAQPA